MIRHTLWGGLIILLLVAVACSKKDKVSGEVKTTYLTLKIDGRDKSFSDVQARWIEGGNSLEINATDNGSEWFTLTVLSDVARVPAGTYTLDGTAAFTILSTYSLIGNNGQLHYTATKGTLAIEDAFKLNIDKIDNSSTEGSFTGVLVRVEGENTIGTVTLSDGKFKTTIKPN